MHALEDGLQFRVSALSRGRQDGNDNEDDDQKAPHLSEDCLSPDVTLKYISLCERLRESRILLPLVARVNSHDL